MFNVSFSEVLVVVTAAGLLLGRKELTIGSKFAGNLVGKLVGSLQGLRVKYEQKSSSSELNTLHTSVRNGLRDLSTVGYDLMSVSPMRIISSPLVPQNYNSQIQYSTNIPAYNPDVTVNPVFSPVMVTNPLDGSTAVYQPTAIFPDRVVVNMNSEYASSVNEAAEFNAARNIQNMQDIPQYTQNVPQNAPQNSQNNTSDNQQLAATNYHLSRLIVAEKELFMRQQHDAQLRNGGKPVPNGGDYPAQPGGADILHSVISDCIMADTYNK